MSLTWMDTSPALASPAPVRRAQAIFLGLIALHLMVALGVTSRIELVHNADLILAKSLFAILIMLGPFTLFVLGLRRLVLMAVVERPDRPLAVFLTTLREVFLDLPRMATGTMLLAAIIVFVAAFGYLKAAVPVLNPFSWDVTFMRMDRALFLGHDAWQVLRPLSFTPAITTALNAAYHFWLLVMYFFVLVACFARADARLRMTFLIAFVLVWALGGNFLATVFSSAGPVFYERLGLGADFAPLMTTLAGFDRVSSVWALDVQEKLWRGYIDPAVPALGISAFPSMHLASTTLLALAAAGWRRWAGWLMAGFTAVIFVGSIQLGYHYAVDSIAGILLAIGFWRLAAAICRDLPGRDQPAPASRAT
mgnify:CR=1 FL=1